jgi:hypothetical protein
MTDIVKQLRQKPPVYETCLEAADTIERLQKDFADGLEDWRANNVYHAYKIQALEATIATADIEADYAEMARQKTEKLAKVLRLARGELIAMMLRAQPNADTERVVDLLTDTLEGLK